MSSKNPQSDYDQALALKDAGNAAFKTGDFKGALKNYSRIFMHIGMNPCMNMSQMMGQGGSPPNPATPSSTKDPLQQKTDELRLTAFNNMAAVYAKMQKWDDCKDKCTRVLKHDDKNTKALFRRGMAHRKLNLYELARADLEKAKKILDNKTDAAIQRELKLLEKDEKNADKAFYASMKKQMQKAKKKKKKKQQQKADKKKKAQEEEAKIDDNPNIKSNQDGDDDTFMWDIPDGNDNNMDNDGNNKETSNNNKDKNENKDKDKDKNNKSTEQPSEF